MALERTAAPATRVDLGRVEVTSLTDAVLDMPRADAFPTVDDESWRTFGRLYGDTVVGGAWRARIGCFVIRGHGRTILVDSGLGPAEVAHARALGIGGDLPSALAAHGVGVEEVDTVLLTHLHADHVGWNVDRRGRPVFPNARYAAPEAEWALLRERLRSEPDAPAFATENVAPLAGLGLLDTFVGGSEVAPGVRTIDAPGHSPGHVAVRVEGSAATMLLLGDAAVHPLQLTEPRHAFCFDEDRERAYDSRKALTALVEPDRTLVAAPHFPEPGFGRLSERDGRLVWRALVSG